MTRTEQPVSTLPGWLRLAATVLGRPQRQLADEAATSSFLDLGGSSLRALELVATAERDLASTLELSALLTEQPLRLALGAVRPVRLPTSAAAPVPGSTRPASPSQVAMIVGEQLYGGSAFHLLFTADVAAALEEDRLRTSVAGLLAGHEGLRTVVEPGPNGLSARVIAQPRVPLQVLAVPPATAVVPEVQRLLAAASRDVLRPTEQPAIQFYLTPAGPRRTLVSLLVHHALVDGWSIALLWRELFDRYAGAPVPTCQPTLAGSTQDDLLVAARIRELTGVPTAELPSDLTRPPTFDRRGHRLAIELTASDTAAVTRLARRLGCSRNAALLGLWGLVLLRRTDEDRMIIGVSAANRNHANLAAIGLHTNLVPMVVDRSGCTGVGPFLRTVSAALGRALDAQTVPFEGLVAELRAGGQSNRNPVAQFGFAAHDELIPDRMHCGDVDVELTEGHCGGTVFEALLFVQRWPGDAGDGRGRLVLEYATSVVTPALAGALAEDVRQLIDVCAAADDVALACLPGQPATGLAGTVEGSLWSAIESATRVHAERSALRAGQDGRPMSYRQLLVAAEAQSQLLHDVGVRAGDTVFLCAPQRAEEIVAVLAVIRLGARYVGLDPQYPAAVLTDLAARCRPAALLVADDVTLMAPLAVPPVVLVDPWQPAAGPVTVPSCPGGPDQVVSVAFTSGSTGSPKGVLVPAAGVLRLARRPRFMAPDALQRFLRLAPLSFDAATLEIFAPLLSGGTIEILPRAMPSIAELDEFIGARRLTGAWLTAGLFRLAADHRPGMFAGLRQLLTGGDVIPVDQVRQVLRACPGLVLTNGYGPTENTTFTTVFDLTDAGQVRGPVPIGRPIDGTAVCLRSRDGSMTPLGGIGELWAAGAGVALGYLGEPALTQRSFPVDAAGVRWYRTGDQARYDDSGELRFLGRRDRQLKIAGHRVELDGVEAAVRGCPGVLDAVVLVDRTAGDPQLCCGLRLAPATDVAQVRRAASQLLAGYAVPALWCGFEEFPLTAQGKLDSAAVLARAGAAPEPVVATTGATVSEQPAPAPAPHPAGPDADIAEIVAHIWQGLLGTSDFGYDERFFDLGGDSAQLLRVRDALRAAVPGCSITVLDLMRRPTIAEIAEHLRVAGAAR